MAKEKKKREGYRLTISTSSFTAVPRAAGPSGSTKDDGETEHNTQEDDRPLIFLFLVELPGSFRGNSNGRDIMIKGEEEAGGELWG